jgi:hypothetical protein
VCWQNYLVKKDGMDLLVANNTDIEAFRKCWIEEFRLQSQLPRNRPARPWEGSLAFTDLNRADELFRVLPHEAGDLSFRELTERLMMEVRGYNRCATRVDSINQSFNDAHEGLLRAEKLLAKLPIEDSPVKRETKQMLDRTVSMIKEQRLALERRRDVYWDELMLASDDEKAHWSLDFTKTEWTSYGTKRIFPETPTDVAAWAERFNKFKYPAKLNRRIDVDSRYQVRFAVVLRHFLKRNMSGVSLKTIGRLVVLTYICGDLAVERDGKLTIPDTGKDLGVGAVDQKLREAGLK